MDDRELKLHEAIALVVAAHKSGPRVDEALATCDDMECYECGRITCPTSDPLHFHHDGCPSCERAAAMEGGSDA